MNAQPHAGPPHQSGDRKPDGKRPVQAEVVQHDERTTVHPAHRLEPVRCMLTLIQRVNTMAKANDPIIANTKANTSEGTNTPGRVKA